MYRNGILSAETEVRNRIVAAMHASRCNVICQTDNSDTTKLPIKSVNLEMAKFVETVRYKRLHVYDKNATRMNSFSMKAEQFPQCKFEQINNKSKV